MIYFFLTLLVVNKGLEVFSRKVKNSSPCGFLFLPLFAIILKERR